MSSDDLVKLRHHIHSIAEVSGEEEQTADFIEETLKSYEPEELITKIGGHGILARFKGAEDGPVVLIRCELDALPIAEENDLEYQSKNKENGHKCGHDGHMAILCGVAHHLSKEGVKAGEVLLLFQPAEETGSGAQRVLEDKKFKDVKADYMIALHNLPGYEKHRIVVRSGVFAAASVGFIARLKGETAHAAHPEEGKSPAAAVAQMIQSFSSLTQFEVPMDKTAKVTVIGAHLGNPSFGVSPGSGEVMATLRTYDDKLLKKLVKKMEELAKGIARTFNLDIDIEYQEPFSATVNDGETVEIIRTVAGKNDLKITDKNEPFGWSEDFGHFTNKFKGAMFGLGSGKDHPALHAADYDFPDEIIETGVNMFVGIIEQITKNK